MIPVILESPLANSRVAPPHGACVLVSKLVPGDERPWVLGIEGPKGTGLPGGRIEPGEPAAIAAMRELLEETGLAIKIGAIQYVLPVRATDNGDIAHGFEIHARDTFGELTPSKEGTPVWLRPEDLVRDRPGHPPVRFPKYNEWALRALGLLV